MNPSYFTSYQSPFSWRYGSEEVRHIWSENNKRLTWRRIWIALAKVQSEYGLVSPEQLNDLSIHAEDIDINRALEIEGEIHHDLMAEVKTYAEQCSIGGRIIHLGMTSTDIVDNADAIRVRESLDIIQGKLSGLLKILVDLIDRWAAFPTMGFTHIQPAEPTTLGYRFAQYAQDLYTDWSTLDHLRRSIKGKGFKGATGTSASFSDLIGLENLTKFEARMSTELDLPFFQVSTQVYPRKQDYYLLAALAGMGASLYKFAFDLRILQSPPIGEWSEPFGAKQVGSSAMPFKRNPIQAEKINSLTRILAQFPRIAWDNAALTILERTLDDSASRRVVIPEAFLIADEILQVSINILADIQIHEEGIKRTLTNYGPFAAIERILMALGKAGADRQEMHERLRKHSLTAWEAIQSGNENPLADIVSHDSVFLDFLQQQSLIALMDSSNYHGDAASRARHLADEIRNTLKFPGKQ